MIVGSTSLDDSFTQGTLVTKCRMCKQEALLNHDFVCKTCWICNSRSPGVPTLSLDLTKDENFMALAQRVLETVRTLRDLSEIFVNKISMIEERLEKAEDYIITDLKTTQGATNDMESVPLQTDN